MPIYLEGKLIREIRFNGYVFRSGNSPDCPECPDCPEPGYVTGGSVRVSDQFFLDDEFQAIVDHREPLVPDFHTEEMTLTDAFRAGRSKNTSNSASLTDGISAWILPVSQKRFAPFTDDASLTDAFTAKTLRGVQDVLTFTDGISAWTVPVSQQRFAPFPAETFSLGDAANTVSPARLSEAFRLDGTLHAEILPVTQLRKGGIMTQAALADSVSAVKSKKIQTETLSLSDSVTCFLEPAEEETETNDDE
jgi:hypothetical protein